MGYIDRCEHGLNSSDPNTKCSRNSSGGSVATGYGWTTGIRIPVGTKFLSSPQRLDRLWAHPATFPTGTGGKFHGAKAAEAWDWPLTYN
jgi:hypothetical protein